MPAALTFSPGQVLMLAIVILALVLVAIWGIWQGDHDRVQRARDRAYLDEVHRLSEGDHDEPPH